jgi:hypothetical protein
LAFSFRSSDPVFVALKYYLLAGATMGPLCVLSDLPVVKVFFWKLSWRLGPYSSFPWPYDFSEYLSGPFGWGGFIFLILLSTVLFAMVSTIVHAAAFGLTAVVHQKWGWPQYWGMVRARLDRSRAWVLSLKRAWWLGPLFLSVYVVIDYVTHGLQYAFYPLLDPDSLLLVAPVGAAVLAVFFISNPILRVAIADLVSADDLRCQRCGYLLRGLEIPRCPECGHDNSVVGPPPYGIGLRWVPGWLGSRIFRLIVLAGLTLAPVWVPAVVAGLPLSIVQHLPQGIAPRWQLAPNPDSFPIWLDSVCVIRQGQAIAVVRFPKDGSYRRRYTAWYWAKATELGRPPDATATGKLGISYLQLDLPIGPWTLQYHTPDQGMFWLTRPNASYAVEAFEPERFESIYPVAKGLK